MKNIDNIYLIIILVICVVIFLLCTNKNTRENFYQDCPTIPYSPMECTENTAEDYKKKRKIFLEKVKELSEADMTADCKEQLITKNNEKLSGEITKITEKKDELVNNINTNLLNLDRNKDLADLEEINMSMVRDHRIANSDSRRKWIKVEYTIYIVLIITFLVIQAFLLFFLL